MKFNFERRVLWGFLFTMLVILILGVFSYQTTQRLIGTARLLTHTTQVTNSAEQLIKSIVDIETGQRGFVITNNENFLEPYYTASGLLETSLSRLEELTSNNDSQFRKVKKVRALIGQQLAWTKNVIASRKENFEKARDLVAGGEGKRITDSIRANIKSIQKSEEEIFTRGNTITGTSLQQFQYSFMALAIAIAGIIVYLFYAVNSALKERNDVELELQKNVVEMRDLYDNAPCGYFALDKSSGLMNVNQTLLNWVGYSRAEVLGQMKFTDLLSNGEGNDFIASFSENPDQYGTKGFVSDREFNFVRKDGTEFPVLVNSTGIFDQKGAFVSSRSTVSNHAERKKAEDRIKLLNQELESFTYSVSHDLRSPLRSITGYAQIVREDYGPLLGEEGQKATDIVISSSLRMGQLIDDLLDFSRLGRKELSRSTINMDNLVKDIVNELKQQEPERNVKVNSLPLSSAKGDPSMVRQVWVNLISNAFKYTRKKPTAEIEIGSYPHRGKTCYYINDNGAGFEMEYAGKLFGVFQRLHKMSEFEGTGVGLALVKSIVVRHGGEVWAEGRPNEGAKFYFTLPN